MQRDVHKFLLVTIHKCQQNQNIYSNRRLICNLVKQHVKQGTITCTVYKWYSCEPGHYKNKQDGIISCIPNKIKEKYIPWNPALDEPLATSFALIFLFPPVRSHQ